MPYDDGTTHPHTVQEGKKKIRRSCGARVQARVRNMAGINEFVHEKRGNAFSITFPPRPFNARNGKKKRADAEISWLGFYLFVFYFRERFVRLCTFVCVVSRLFNERRHITEAKQVTCEIKLHGTNNNNSRLDI
jgi:hypothetical protein